MYNRTEIRYNINTVSYTHLDVYKRQVQEVEKRLLGVETNITNWQRRQNANNNFSAVIPYDLEMCIRDRSLQLR